MQQFKPWDKYEQDLEIYTKRFLDNELTELCYQKVMELQVSYAYSDEPVPFDQIHNLNFVPIQIGQVWATKNFACAWFHLTGKLPEGTDRQELYLDYCNDGEALLVDRDGSAVKGFTTGSPVFGVVDRSVEKRHFPLAGWIEEDGTVDLYIDGASNSLLGEFNAGCSKLQRAYIVRRDPKMQDIYWDFDVLMDYVGAVTAEDPYKYRILNGLRSVRNLIVYQDPQWYEKAKAITAELLSLPGQENTRVTAVGHAHLDLAWLWPIRESYRKAKRTFANMLSLLENYPEYQFVISQPQQLAWMKEQDPKLYETIRHYEKLGRIEIVGGGWVENDTNIPCDESLVRQELYGQKFWQEEFGHYVNLRWLPDTFGYSASLPQILKLSAQDNFMTIKISWSNRTIFPYNTFRWAGIDGSNVTVHMPPEGNYNSVAGPKALLAAKKGLQQTDPQDKLMVVYGVGDGGGGPSQNIVERNMRTANVPYLPKVKMGSAQDYFDALQQDTLPVYSGEMYLEKHRGTYTSQSNNKNNNREFEEKMLALEQYLSCKGISGDRQQMDTLWKEALLYQFHDILPGSSIARVYEETDAAYSRIFEKLEALAQQQGLSFVPAADKGLINPARRHFCKAEPAGEGYLFFQGSDALVSPVVYASARDQAPICHIETDYYCVDLEPDGSFRELTLKANGQVMAHSANKLRVFIDTGDAWDFEDDYRDQPEQYMQLTGTDVRNFGDLIELRQHYTFRSSRLTQTLVFHRQMPYIGITHDVDWKDTGYMLRSETTPAVWSDTVHSDIQFGYLDRPTTDGNAHDKAQFEICCQKWFAVSGEGSTFAVLNNAKNGFMAKQGILSVNLLRSTNYPCVCGDQRHSRYAYAFYPMACGFDPVKLDEMAQQYGQRDLYGDQMLDMPAFDKENIQITAFKPAYDGDGFILRAFERAGVQTQADMHIPAGFALAGETDLLEDPVQAAPETDLSFRPFQIRTFRFRKQ